MTRPQPREQAEGLVNQLLGDRLRDANEPPGLRDAIVDRIIDCLDDIGQRGRAQMDQLRSPSSRRIPDAYLADEEAAENELQASASGIRAARALEGVLSSDPRQFEYDLARRLAPDAMWSLRAEASRVPIPPTRPSVLNWSLAPISWVESESEWPPGGAIALADRRQLHDPDGEPERVAEPPHFGWVQLAMFEQQRTLGTSYPKVPARQLMIALGLEICDEPPPARSMPLSRMPPNAWAVPVDGLIPGHDADPALARLDVNVGPLAAIVEYSGQRGTPSRDRGAGLHPFPLVPIPDVVALLGLRPETPALRHVLVDELGQALVGRLWRGFLVHDGNYSHLEPAVCGADLLLRPDLYEVLERSIGRDRLRLGLRVSHSEGRADADESDPED